MLSPLLTVPNGKEVSESNINLMLSSVNAGLTTFSIGSSAAL